MKIDVSIVIVTYNGLKWISKCLKSCDPFSVIVVDNKSSDDTVSYIQKNFPKVTILQQDRNLGFGAANNIGISHALKQGSEYVFLLNQDAYLDKDTISALVNVHKQNTEYGILSPVHLNGKGMKLDYNFSKYIKLNTSLQKEINQRLFSKQIYEVPFVNAAAWLLSKEVIETVGGFDPIFFHYSEDVNYCQRTVYHNIKIGIVPNVYMRHDRELKLKKEFKNYRERLKHFERSTKQNWANINIDISNVRRLKKKIIVKAILKSIFRLKFDELVFNVKKYRLLDKILPEINESRRINIEKGLHYLDH